jgi:hypothetical protein
MPDWNFNNLEFLIQDRGDEVIHETAVSCPCRAQDHYAGLIAPQNRTPKVRKMTCEQCNGIGYIYRNAQVIRGLLTSINSGNRQMLDIARAEPGDCTFSPSLDVSFISDFDKITFTIAVPIDDGQQIMRGAGTMEDNAGLNTRLETNEDRLWYLPECTIWCEDQNGVVYTQNTDFEFDNKLIRWIGSKPTTGVLYTIKYTAYLEWICFTTPMTRIDNARSLGQRVLLKKQHVVFPNDPGDTPAARKEIEINFTTKTSL